ncbi:MAG: LamG domain-containing protein, partial [Candidatus Berkelbacteria bacterium]
AQTVSMWVAEGAGNSGFIFDDQNTTGTLFSGDQVGGGWAMWFQQTPGNYVHVSGPAMTPGQWYLETYVRDGATMSFYRNGEKIADDQILPGGASGDTFINGVGDWSRYKGSLDEAQISTVARSADWIKTEYNNQNDVSVFYSLAATEAGDTIPPTNPTTINGYDTAAKGSLLANGSWNYFTNPYFEFSGATDDSSGIAGYYIYFGTDVSADPQTAGSYQVHAGGTPATQYYTSGSTLATGSTYYLKIKTKDTNSNISAAATLFTYKFDNIAPNPPEYVNVSPVGCSTQTSFTFNWPVAADAGGSDFKTYQYRRGTTGTITDVVDTTLQAFAYQDGDNVLYVRTEDNAGNVSSWQTSVFCSTAAIQVVSGPDVAAGPSSITATWVSSKATTGYVKVYDGNTYISEQGLTNYSLSHTVKVIGLVPEKQYRYQITWTDQSGNLGESDWYTTTTATAPQINNLTAQIISPTSANISWNSTVPAQFNLEYGIGNYGTTIPSTDFLNGYSGKIDGLSSGETYQFRVDATGQDGTKFFAGQSVAMPPLPSIGSLKFQPIANRPDTAITVSWTTNTETTSSVFYGPVGQAKVEVSTSDKIKDHKIDIGNLSDNSDYEIYATGIDQFGNVAKSLMETFKTAYDTRPPVMANISTESSNIGTSSDSTAQITVGLTTDEPAKCMLEYGGGISGTTYSGRTTDDEIFETNHIAVISGLKPQSPYHFRINCSDKSGNKATSSDQTVISGEITQSVFNIIIKTLNNLFGWMGTKL